MAWEWLAPVAKGIFAIWQTTATIATGIACPPCVPVVTGAFALIGIGMNAGLDKLKENNIKAQIDGLSNQEMMMGLYHMLNATAAENKAMMKEIQMTLKNFEENMNRNFDELKVFIVEKEFTDNVRIPIELLWDEMESASESRTKDSVERFLNSYRSRPARRILAELIKKLNYSYSNPITIAMENNVMNSRAIMDHYMQYLSHIIFKVLAIEGFYFGVADFSEDDSAVYLDGLSKDIDKAIKSFGAFVTSYKIPTEKYWPAAVNQTIISNNDVSNVIEVADKIKNKLDGIYTTDVFSVFVFPCGGQLCDIPLIRKNDNDDWDSIWSRERHYMLDKYNKITKIEATVIRSEKYHEVHAHSLPLLRTGFRSYANLMKRMEPFPCEADIYLNTGNDPFLDVLEETFKPNLVNGLIICSANSTSLVSRFTNNGSALLTAEDTDMIPKYYALTWI